jgi:hypothetical protein
MRYLQALILLFLCIFQAFSYPDNRRLQFNYNSLDLNDCLRQHDLVYVPDKLVKNRTTPILLNFRGSGATWIRLIIERTVGYFTGSLPWQVESRWHILLFGGEDKCGLKVSVINVHPEKLYFSSNGVLCKEDILRDYCNWRGGRPFNHIILLTRDPYRVIYSEYFRMIKSYGRDYNHKEFYDYAINYAREIHFQWSHIIHPFMQSLNENTNRTFHIIKYEDMIDVTKQLIVLKDLTQYMKFQYDETKGRCAFHITESPLIHRNNTIQYVKQAYSNHINLICGIWEHTKDYAGTFGYTIWNNESC